MYMLDQLWWAEGCGGGGGAIPFPHPSSPFPRVSKFACGFYPPPVQPSIGRIGVTHPTPPCNLLRRGCLMIRAEAIPRVEV